MAKAKKTAALTVGERLEQALVPEGEQPYPVPGNWDWVNLPFVCKYIRAGGDKPACFSEEKTDITTIPVVANGISNEGIVGYTDIANENENTITISGRGTIGFSVLRKYPYYPIIRLIVICPKENINSLFIKYIFDHFLENGTGSSIPQLTVPMLKNKAIPIPPFAEQQRIVDRIESLFAKLDEAKEKAQAALDSFETRKAAILHKAFTGELTAKWRKENGVGMDSWVKNVFEQVADIKSNLVSPLDYPQYPHIAPDNIEKRTGKLLEYRTVLEDNVISGKHRFYAGQILYSKIRPYLSKVVMVDFDGLCSADMYPIEAKEDTKYLWYYMLSDGFLEQASSAGSRSVLPKINQKELASLYVIRPSINEQKQIVYLLDSFFAKEQKAKELCFVLDSIDLIKKSILARAFRGELCTNDPTEESAVELLKNIFL